MPTLSLYPECPKGRGRRVPLRGGGYGRSSCHSYDCPLCGRHDVKRKAAVLTTIATTAPHAVWVTLTRAPRSEADRKAAVINFRSKLMRRVGRGVEMAWVTEVSQRGAWHIHAILHGQPMEPWEIQEAWGSGVKVKDTHSAVGGYMLKDALDCPGSSARGFHFDINAGRPFRHTRGFYGDVTTFDEAWRIARTTWAGNSGGTAEPRTPTPVVPLTVLINSTRQ